jgi:hypothetical protein
MGLATIFLDALGIAASKSHGPLVLPWPMPGNPGNLSSFRSFAEWQEFLLRFSLNDNVPLIVAAKFERAQKLYLLTWIEFDLIKAGELLALSALELALRDRYGDKVRRSNGAIHFADLLKYMPEHDELTDDKLPIIRRCGGSVVTLLTGARRPSLANIRNEMAHGDPFDGLPWAGLIELVRDLIEYAYRDLIVEAQVAHRP